MVATLPFSKKVSWVVSVWSLGAVPNACRVLNVFAAWSAAGVFSVPDQVLPDWVAMLAPACCSRPSKKYQY